MPIWSRPTDYDEDPAVAQVEAILGSARRFAGIDSHRLQGPVDAVHALSICACVTLDDAPTWLIYDTADGALAWCRKGPDAEIQDYVRARAMAWGHADPAAVLRWLRDGESDPWGGGGSGGGDESILEALRAAVRDK